MIDDCPCFRGYVFSQRETIPIPINGIGMRLPPNKIDKECVTDSSES